MADVFAGTPFDSLAFGESGGDSGNVAVERSALLGWAVSQRTESHIFFSEYSAFDINWGVSDLVTIATALDSLLQSNQSIFDSAVFADIVRNAYPVSVNEVITLNAQAQYLIRIAMLAATAIQFQNPRGFASQQTTFTHTVATSLVLRSIVGTAKNFGDLIATAEFADTVAAVIRAVDEALTQISLESQSSLYFNILLSSESLVSLLTDTSQFSSVYNEVGDTILFVGALGIDNEDYIVWAVHPQYPAATEYENYEFNSFAQVGSTYLGAAYDGIYELSGSNDAGANIAAVVRTGLLDFGASQLKQVTRAYLGYTSDNRLILKTIATDGGQKTERWYELRDKTADDIREARIKLGKGVKSRYWQFELINTDGGDFEIDQLQLLPLMLSRRVKE